MGRIWTDPWDGRTWDISQRIGGGKDYPDLVIFVSEDAETRILRIDQRPEELTNDELCWLLDRSRIPRI